MIKTNYFSIEVVFSIEVAFVAATSIDYDEIVEKDNGIEYSEMIPLLSL